MTFVSITEQKVIQQSLHEKEAQFGPLVQNMGNVIIRMAPDSTIRCTCPSCQKRFGHKLNDMIGARPFLTSSVPKRPTQYYTHSTRRLMHVVLKPNCSAA